MRTPITLKIKFKSSNLDQFIERYSVDVSRGGIFIRTKEPLPVGTQLRFEFQLQDASSLIAGDGTVVWIREHDPARQGVAPGMGVRFDKLAADSQKVLDRILSEKQKRGDAQLESRFDAGVRASASASGTLSSSARVAGHNDFSGGESRSATPLPGAIPGLASPDDEFGNESTRVMQNELVQSLADRTRGEKEDAANAFSEPEPTRKASVEELKLAVQGSAIEKAAEPEPKKEEPKVEVAPEAKKEEPKPVVVEAKKEEPKPVAVEAKKEEPKKEEPKKEEAKPVEAKAEEKKSEPVARNAKHKKSGQHRAEAKNGEAKKSEEKSVKPAEKKEDKAAVAAPYPKASEPARKRSAWPLYAGVAVVALVGGYTVFRDKGGDDAEQAAAPQQAAQPQAAAAQPAATPEPPKVAQTDTPKPTESQTAAEAKGDKPAGPATPAEAPNPAKPEKEPTAALAKPAGLDVAITSDPAGANVLLDGKPVDGVTPTRLIGLDTKKVYDVKLSMKGFHDWKVKLKPKTGDKIDAALVPNEKIVEVATTPPGADVMLDGKRVGKTPYTIHKLDLSKSHALEVKRSGFVPQTRSISATDTFEPKGDKDVLAVAMTLEAAPKPVVAEKSATPAAVRPAKPAHKAPAVKKPAEASSEKPAEASSEKPAAEKPAEAAAEKPAASEKPAGEKPAAAEKPASEEKPASSEKPAGGIKVPSWMKQKQPEGGDKASAPAGGDTATP